MEEYYFGDEIQLFLPNWSNGYSIPYFNKLLQRYYVKDIYDGLIVQASFSKTKRELVRKMKDYKSPNH